MINEITTEMYSDHHEEFGRCQYVTYGITSQKGKVEFKVTYGGYDKGEKTWMVRRVPKGFQLGGMGKTFWEADDMIEHYKSIREELTWLFKEGGAEEIFNMDKQDVVVH